MHDRALLARRSTSRGAAASGASRQPRLVRLADNAGPFEPLREMIERVRAKGEQEVYQRDLYALFVEMAVGAERQLPS